MSKQAVGPIRSSHVGVTLLAAAVTAAATSSTLPSPIKEKDGRMRHPSTALLNFELAAVGNDNRLQRGVAYASCGLPAIRSGKGNRTRGRSKQTTKQTTTTRVRVNPAMNTQSAGQSMQQQRSAAIHNVRSWPTACWRP